MAGRTNQESPKLVDQMAVRVGDTGQKSETAPPTTASGVVTKSPLLKSSHMLQEGSPRKRVGTVAMSLAYRMLATLSPGNAVFHERFSNGGCFYCKIWKTISVKG